MPSVSLNRWRTLRATSLEQVELGHTAIGGTGRGARYARQQLNRSYCVLLAAEFQGFCRELHDEAVDALVFHLTPSFRLIVRTELVRSRQVDRGNANPSNLGGDFNRLGFQLWPDFDVAEPRGPLLRRLLEELNAWRNAVPHSDYDPARLGGTITLTIARVRRWRRACHRVARVIDRVTADHIGRTTGIRPWA
jgi:hypothetical protein